MNSNHHAHARICPCGNRLCIFLTANLVAEHQLRRQAAKRMQNPLCLGIPRKQVAVLRRRARKSPFTHRPQLPSLIDHRNPLSLL